MSARNDLRHALEMEIQRHGVRSWNWEVTGSCHYALCFRFRERDCRFITAYSPGDTYHGMVNAVTELRRMMGVKRIVNKNPANRRRRNPPEQPLTAPELSAEPRPDPWEALSNIRVGR